MPIWPGAVPDARPITGPETAPQATSRVAGKSLVYIEFVSQPTLTVYAPKERNTGAAVVVFPGGGYQILAIDLEGTEACDWLTAKGITCVLLKYRVPGNGRRPHSGPYPYSPEALAEIHIYARGGHAFGLRRTEQPITEWPTLVEIWLRTIGVVRSE